MINVEAFREVLGEYFGPNTFTEKELDNGGFNFFGPFGSFIFIVNDKNYEEDLIVLVSENGSPSDTAFFVLVIQKDYPSMVYGGPYCEVYGGNNYVFDDESIANNVVAWTLEKANTINRMSAMADTQSLIVPDEKKIIV